MPKFLIRLENWAKNKLHILGALAFALYSGIFFDLGFLKTILLIAVVVILSILAKINYKYWLKAMDLENKQQSKKQGK